jgi:hypothetical protein
MVTALTASAYDAKWPRGIEEEAEEVGNIVTIFASYNILAATYNYLLGCCD